MSSVLYVVGILFMVTLVCAVVALVGLALVYVLAPIAGVLGWGSRDAPQAVAGQGQYIPPAIRRAVLQRDEYRCRECGSGQELEMDHVIPKSKGGATTVENLQVLCHPCNSRKGAN